MRLVIVTGMSGAGKSTTLHMLEDAGYYCVDNLPLPLVPKLAELLNSPNEEFTRIALGLDIRNGSGFSELYHILDQMKETGLDCEVLFLDSSTSVLVKRYKETRRSHPLSGNGRVDEGIERERALLRPIKKRADYILDTSQMLTRELRQELAKIFLQNKDYKSLFVTVLSFGFKYGIPNDADLVFDVRFLPNPYYIEELRHMSGNDQEVRKYVMDGAMAQPFVDRLIDMIQFLIPGYIEEGKNQLVIAIGCTGGKHRSVTIANELYESLIDQDLYGVKIEHRDMEKDAIRKML
jgi:UPF0042 nucleotide-binding protein